MPTAYLLHRRGAFMLALAVLVLVLAGCGSTESVYSLVGGQWQAQSYSNTRGTVEVPNGENYTLTFADDNTFTGTADCNLFRGNFTQTRNEIRINTSLSTRVECPPPSLASEYLDLLARVVGGGVDENGVLVLRTPDDANQIVFVNPDGPTVVEESAAGFLGLPWWLWLLLGLLLLGLLWWLFGRSKPEPPRAEPVARPEPVVKVEPEAAGEVAEPPILVEDDLTLIEGIGPKTNEVLHDAGLHTFEQLASASQPDLHRILEAAGLTGAYGDPTTWPEQAALAAAGQWEELRALQDKLDRGRAV